MKTYLGDCLEVMDELIANGIRVDAVITDLPYGLTKCSWDSIIDFNEMWIRINKITNLKGAIILFGLEPFSSRLRLSNIKNYKYDWIWEKSTSTGFLNAKKQPLRAYENIMVFYRKQCLYNPQKTKGHVRKVSSATSKINSTIRTKGKEFVYNKLNLDKLTNYDSTERYPRNIIKFSKDTQKSKLHPTQKPVALIEYLIKTYTEEKQLILDFTAGSFSTAIACLKTGRDYIMIEKNEEYFNIGNKRIECYKGKKNV